MASIRSEIEAATTRGDNASAVTFCLKLWQLQPYNVENAYTLIKNMSVSIPMTLPIEQLKLAFIQAKKTIQLNVKPIELPFWYQSYTNVITRTLSANNKTEKAQA